MKKIIILIFAILLANVVIVTAQTPTNEEILNIIEQGGNVASIIWPQWIPGINNGIIISFVSTIGTAILAFFHRRKTIRRWEKEGKQFLNN